MNCKCKPIIINCCGCNCDDDQNLTGGAGNNPYIGENGNWFTWDETTQAFEDTGVRAQGQDGIQGIPGKDNYEIYLEEGGTLTRQEWLDSITTIEITAYSAWQNWQALDPVNNTASFDDWISSKIQPTTLRCSGTFQDQSLAASVFTQVTPIVDAGTASLVSGRRFIAPFKGTVEIFCSGSFVGALGNNTLNVIKNRDNITSADRSGLMGWSIVTSSLGIPSVFAKFNVNKNDYISCNFYSTAAQSTIKSNLTESYFFVEFTQDIV